VNPTELKAEERLIWANQVSFDMARRMLKAIEENYGPKRREIATGALYDVGHELGLRFRNLLQIKGTEPLDYTQLHHYIDTNLSRGLRIAASRPRQIAAARKARLTGFLPGRPQEMLLSPSTVRVPG
jgi:hypothetical protein